MELPMIIPPNGRKYCGSHHGDADMITPVTT